jgi:hypothetical protein
MYVCVLDYTLNKKEMTEKDVPAPANAKVLYRCWSSYLTLTTFVMTTDSNVRLN